LRLFGRRQPIHRRLAADGGVNLGDGAPPPTGLSAAPPGWDGEQRGEPGIHGVPRPRQWDAVVTADAAGIRGDTVRFVALTDGSLVVDEEQPDGAVAPLADALAGRLRPPSRAAAVRRHGSLFGVAGRRVTVVREPGLDGDEAELVVAGRDRTLTVDGAHRVARARALEAAGAEEGPEYVVRASRIEDDLWEVEASAL
jgi:hypothetical protein